MSNSNVLTLRVPDSLKDNIVQLAQEQGVSMNHLASYLLTKGVSAMQHANTFEKYRAASKSDEQVKAEFDALWSELKQRNSDKSIPDWDKMPSDN